MVSDLEMPVSTSDIRPATDYKKTLPPKQRMMPSACGVARMAAVCALLMASPMGEAFAQSSKPDHRGLDMRERVEARDLVLPITEPDSARTAPTPGSSALLPANRMVRMQDVKGNWFEKWILQLQGMLGAPAVIGGQPSPTASRLGDSFSDLEEYQDIYVLAAGWNGDRFYQYRLGLMFENGAYPVQPNPVAAYFWYSLAAAQGLDVAKRQRRQLLASDVEGQLRDDDLNEVYLKFIEIYIFGGTEAQYRLGQILESDFFNNELHDQDALRADGNAPRRRIIHAYAAYTLAGRGGDTRATYAIQELVENYTLNQVELETGERFADRWAELVGLAEDPEDPFDFTPERVSRALERGNEFQKRRSDPIIEHDRALSWLRSGQAFQARGDVRSSKIAFETAIRVDPNSRAAMHAQQQLQRLSTTCSAASFQPVDDRRGGRLYAPVIYPPGHPLSRVKEVRIAAQQRALKALGFYDGPVDNVPGKGTRAGFRLFLASLNLDQRDYLDAPQVVELICMAAQLRGHAASQTVLGVMYAEGIGVAKDEDLAHYWFGEGARQNDPSAIFNMGMMYARERGLPFKNHPQSCSIAYSYLKEAADLKHPQAPSALRKLKQEPACRGKAVPKGIRRDRGGEARYDDDEEQGEERGA